MIALWMIYAFGVTATLAAAATILDQAAGTATRQRRWIWMLALTLSAGVPAWSALGPRMGTRIGSTVERDDRVPPAVRASMAKSASAIADLVARAESRSLGSMSAVLGIVWIAGVGFAVLAYAAAT